MFVTNTIVCLLATVCALSRTTDANCNVLHAAFGFGGQHFFLYGDGKIMVLDNKGNKHWSTSVTHFGFDRQMTAGVEFPPARTVFQYSGDGETTFLDIPFQTESLPLSFLRHRLGSILGQIAVSVDAAYLGDDWTFTYFSGCDYLRFVFNPQQIIRVTSLGKNEELGLPCDLDAAWSSSDHKLAYIVKGDQLYQISGNDRPRVLSVVSIFPALSELNLCPRP